MESKRHVLLWSSIAAALGIFLWLITLDSARVAGGEGDSIRILVVSVGTNLIIVWSFFLFAFVGRRAGFLAGLADRSLRGRAGSAAIGVLAALAGYLIGHVLVWSLWGSSPPRPIGRALELNISVIPIVLGILLVLSTLMSLGVRTVRSTRLRLGLVFTFALLPSLVLLAPALFDEVAIAMNAIWLPTVESYRGPVTTPENEFTSVFVEPEVVDRGYLPEVVQGLLRYRPEDLVILVNGVAELRNGVYGVSWHGIEPILLSPPSETRLAVGHAGVVSPRFQSMPPESLAVAIRPLPMRMTIGDPTSTRMYTTVTDESGRSLMEYLSERSGLPTGRFQPGDRHLINLHQGRVERWGREVGGDAMRISAQTAGDSWTLDYDPQLPGVAAVFSYVYDRTTSRIVPSNEVSQPTLERLAGRRIIVDALPQTQPYYDNHVGLSLVTDLVNARHGLGFRYVPGWMYLACALLFHLTALVCFLRFRAMVALWLLVLLHALLATVMVILFVELNVLAAPMFFWGSTTLVGGVLFINTFLREQREAVEERTRLETELNTARQMQMGLMPASDPRLSGFEVAGLCRPANEVGGDFYAYLASDKHPAHIGIAVADVSGKAMKAAITAIMTSGMLYEAAKRSSAPNEILDAINAPLHERSDKRVFTAMVMARLEASGTRRTLTLSNAGQTPPLLVRKGKVTPLTTKGVRLPLGLKEGVRYPKQTFRLRAGDLVFFYTDGMTEASSASGEAYGDERLQAYLRSSAHGTARDVVNGTVSDLQTFLGDRPLADDVTIVAVKVVGGRA